MPDGALGMALVQVLALGGCTAFSSRSNSSTLTHPARWGQVVGVLLLRPLLKLVGAASTFRRCRSAAPPLVGFFNRGAEWVSAFLKQCRDVSGAAVVGVVGGTLLVRHRPFYDLA